MFEDKIITYIAADGTKYKGRVVACVKDIGITIVDASNPSEYLHCLKMKNSPNFIKGKGEITETRRLFTLYRKGIIKGVMDARTISRSSGGYPSHSTCAFGV